MMELQNLDMVNKYADALKRARLGISTISGMVTTDEETRLIRGIVTDPYISVGEHNGIPITKKQAMNCLLEQEKYFEGKLEELKVKAR